MDIEEEKKSVDSDSDEPNLHELEEDLELPYPEECRVLDIMKVKYEEAIRFFTDTNDKKQ